MKKVYLVSGYGHLGHMLNEQYQYCFVFQSKSIIGIAIGLYSG